MCSQSALDTTVKTNNQMRKKTVQCRRKKGANEENFAKCMDDGKRLLPKGKCKHTDMSDYCSGSIFRRPCAPSKPRPHVSYMYYTGETCVPCQTKKRGGGIQDLIDIWSLRYNSSAATSFERLPKIRERIAGDRDKLVGKLANNVEKKMLGDLRKPEKLAQRI